MRCLFVFAAAITFAACSSGSPPPAAPEEPLQSTAGPEVAEAPVEAPPTNELCLPVVAAECGCDYTCGVGVREGIDRYRVTHSFWTEPVYARVDRWCVDGTCTEAFFAEIVCDLICAPKPADPTCHFEGSACVSGR